MIARWILFATVCIAGCTSIGDLPPVDLEQPGWQTWTGQAGWRRERDAPPLAGDLLAGLHASGDVFVSFSKAALPVFTAHTVDDRWQIEFVERGRSYSGRGSPPDRFAWFALPAILDGETAELPGWTIDRRADGELLMENERSGERLHLFVDP